MRNPLHALAAAALAAAAFTSQPAQAWEWNDDEKPAIWRTATLNWAQDIALLHNQQQLSHQDLLDGYDPTPREHWCVENPAPDPTDCAIAQNRLNVWTADFLGLGENEPIPENLPSYPEECLSICQF